ncbi:hypothetical protein ACFLZ6_00975 [Nanoarchaeota archaeon]
MAKVTKGKKQWVSILAPAMFRGRSIGDILILEPQSFVGKSFSVNLMNITNDLRKQNTRVFFEATDYKEGKLNTKICGYEIIPSSIKRTVRRGRDKVTISFVCRTADGVHVRVKPIAITISKINGSANRGMVKKLIEELSKKIKKLTFENLVNNLINQRIQLSWRDELKKVYPLKFFEVRSVTIEKSKKGLKNVVEVSVEQLKEPPKDLKEEKVEAPKTEVKPAAGAPKVEVKPVAKAEPKTEVKAAV